MRIWDVSAGYLNRGSLLGEHRELHGLLSILRHGKRGYSRHPETLRWVGCESALEHRHHLLAAEMRLRGYVDRTPVGALDRTPLWPITFVTPPGEQLELLRSKYAGKEPGRIPLPRNAMELWAQHKYSVLARDPEVYAAIGRRVADAPAGEGQKSILPELTLELVQILRTPPAAPRLANAIEHIWGHVAKQASEAERRQAEESPAARLAVVQRLVPRRDLDTGAREPGDANPVDANPVDAMRVGAMTSRAIVVPGCAVPGHDTSSIRPR